MNVPTGLEGRTRDEFNGSDGTGELFELVILRLELADGISDDFPKSNGKADCPYISAPVETPSSLLFCKVIVIHYARQRRPCPIWKVSGSIV